MEKRVLNDLYTNNNSVLVECGCSCACSFMRLYKECDDRYGISIYSGYYNKKYVKLENKLKFTREELNELALLIKVVFAERDGYTLNIYLDCGCYIELGKVDGSGKNDCVSIIFYLTENSFVKEKSVYDLMLNRDMVTKFLESIATI